MRIKVLRDDLVKYLKKHYLTAKFSKAKKLFENDPFYPSLQVDLLEPRHRLIYS